MAVKHSQSGARVLAVLEKVAQHQPIGISDLAKLMDQDKSGVQRALVTLAREDWIRASPGKPTRWQLTPRIHTFVDSARGNHDLRQRARSELLALRDQTGETVTLNVIQRGQFVVADVAESLWPLRVVLTAGAIVPATDSATGRAILPYLPRERQVEILGAVPATAQIKIFTETVRRGYAISSGIVVAGFTNIGAAIFDADSHPVGALLVTGPSDRLPAKDYAKVGYAVCAAARNLSQGPVPEVAIGLVPPPAKNTRQRRRN